MMPYPTLQSNAKCLFAYIQINKNIKECDKKLYKEQKPLLL